MIQELNALSAQWFETMTMMTIQSSMFLCAILIVLHLLQGKDAKRLRWIALLGLCKLFVPPLNLLPDATETLAIRFSELLVFGNDVSRETAIVADVVPTITNQAMLFIAWIVVASSLFGVSLLRTIALYRRFCGATAMDVSHYGLPKSAHVVKSQEHHSPFVVGAFKPIIVFPVNVEAWSDRMIKTAFAHEVAHLQQYDHLLNVVQTVAKAIYFFNPFVWLLSRKLDELREMSCDDTAVAATKISSADYAAELLAIAERNTMDMVKQRYHNAIAFSERYHSLKTRLTYQLSNKEDLKMRYVIFSSCIILMMALSLNCSDRTKSDGAMTTPLSAPSETPDFVEVDIEPMFINQVRPTYPPIAKQHGVEARVVAKALINENGQAERVEILKYTAADTSAASPERQAFESEVKKSIQASTFKPAMKNGKPVSVWMAVPTHFNLTTAETPKLISVEKIGGTIWAVNFTVPREMQVTVSVANEKTPETTIVASTQKWYSHFQEDGKTHLHSMQCFVDTKDFPRGAYLFKINAEDYSETKRVVLN